MTAPKANPMSRSEIARLGGIARSSDRVAMSLMGRKGASVNIQRNGPDQPLRALAIARGHNIPSVAPSRSAKGSRDPRPAFVAPVTHSSATREPFAGRELDRDPASLSSGGGPNPSSPRHQGNPPLGKEKGRTAANSPTNSYHRRF